jgi:hypothetical protein
MAIWPDVPARAGSARTARECLDYVAWITEEIERIGSHGGPDLESWRQRVHRAYLSLIDSMVPGHGDPLPPDVPPSVRPGTWPDVAAAAIPGMTVRHQLTVLRTVARNALAPRPHQTPSDSDRWASRVVATYEALDHGPTLPLPDGARSAPPSPPAKSQAKSKRSKRSARASKAKAPKSRRPRARKAAKRR